MSIFTLSAFSQNLPNTLPDTGFVGVGTTNPSCNFQVIGQSQISGNLKVDSSLVISDSARVDNNLRVNGNLFVAKNAYITDTTFSNVLQVYRITLKLGDSLVYMGDSSITISSYNTIAASPTTYFNTYYGGMGIGTAARGYAFQSLALGRFSFTNGNYSIALGNYTETSSNATQAITIGSGVSLNNKLINNIPNSIALGTNSNLPTLFISPANGINTTGRVGIGTTTPSATLDIKTTGNIVPNIKLNNNLGLHADLLYCQNDVLTSLIRMGKDANGTTWSFEDRTKQGTDIYKMYIAGNGIVYMREAEINVPAFPDYVFANNYTLMSIKELSDFIHTNKHLPNIPSAKTVEERGSIAVGVLMVKQLEKIEELTLYIIQLEKRISQLENK